MGSLLMGAVAPAEASGVPGPVTVRAVSSPYPLATSVAGRWQIRLSAATGGSALYYVYLNIGAGDTGSGIYRGSISGESGLGVFPAPLPSTVVVNYQRGRWEYNDRFGTLAMTWEFSASTGAKFIVDISIFLQQGDFVAQEGSAGYTAYGVTASYGNATTSHI
ncbi:hypothetical protein [Amycolatopsis sp. NPDC004378]